MLDVGRLRVLLAISEQGELPAAARALGTPAGDAAAQLTTLERELGLPLADGDRLTPAGRRLAAHAGRLLGQLEAAESDAAAVAGRAAGVLRLGIGAAAGRALLPDALATLRSTAPELELQVEQLADERVSALGAARLDVIVVGEFAAAVPRRVDADTERRELLTEPLLVAVPARHPASGVSIRLAELAGERWVGGPVGADVLVALERAAASAGFEPRLVGHAAEDGLALALVAAGVGVALVPASSVPVPVAGVRFLTAVDAGLRRTVTAVVRRSTAADPAVLRLLDALSQAARRVAAAVSGVTAAAAPTPPPPGSRPVPPAGLPIPPPAAREPYAGPPEPRAAAPAEPPSRRPDPLFDPLPGTGRSAAEPERNGAPDRPDPRRRAADPWADRPAPTDPWADRPDPHRDRTPEPLANGHPASNGTPAGPAAGGPYGLEPHRAEPHRGEPYRDQARNGWPPVPAGPPGPRHDAARPPSPTAGPELSRRRRDTGPLPPPGVPADRPRAGAEPPPLPHPTASNLDVRSLSAGELPGRRAAAPGPAGTGSYAERAGTAPSRRSPGSSPAGEPDSLPPAPAGSTDDVRLSIFEDLQSEWFTQRNDDMPPAASWQTAADDGWRAAARLAEPATAGTTTAGLPRRRPQALYVPGTVGTEADNAPNGAAARSPQEVRGRLSSYRDGVRRGRHAEPRED
jgi:DNA-binding transcriptional LysR family regulator